MSAPLKQNCTDFQACQFFSNCKEQIRRIARSSNLQKNVSRTMNKIQQMNSKSNSTSVKTQQLDKMLGNNIVIDYLRSHNNNYSYPVFMRECNVISEEVVGKKQLAVLLGLQEEYGRQERFDVSVIELMIEKLRNSQQKKKKYVDNEVQVEIVRKDGKENNGLIMDNRIREIRDQVQQREKKYYEKMLESMRSKEILQLRDQISRQMEQKMKKQMHKNDKKIQQLIQKAKNNENPSKLKQQNELLISKNYQLSKQLSKIQVELSIAQKQKSTHSCKKSPQYQSLSQSLRQQKKQLQNKKNQLDYALRNINTKVQQLVQRKSKLQNQKKSDRFMQQVRTNKQNKDHMIETIHSQMRQMDNRIKVLAQQNDRLKNTVRELKSKIKGKEQFYSKFSEQFQLRQHSSNSLQQQSRVDGAHSASISMIDKKVGPHDQHIIPEKFIPSYRMSSNASNPQNQKVPKCLQCTRRKSVQKQKIVSVSVGVDQQQLRKAFDNEFGQKQQQRNEQQVSSDSDDEQFQNRTLEHNKKLAKIKTDMNIIKKKVLLLIDENGLY